MVGGVGGVAADIAAGALESPVGVLESRRVGHCLPSRLDERRMLAAATVGLARRSTVVVVRQVEEGKTDLARAGQLWDTVTRSHTAHAPTVLVSQMRDQLARADPTDWHCAVEAYCFLFDCLSSGQDS